MSPHSHSSEVSVKQQFGGQQYYQPSTQSNSSSNPGLPVSGHQTPLNNPALNFNYIVGEIDDFISNTNTNTDLNRSLEEEEEDEIESSNSSMDEMIITGAGNLLDDFFLSNDPNGNIKNEAFDAQFNDMNMLNIDGSHLDYQYINYGGPISHQNQYHQTHQLQQEHHTHSMPQQQQQQLNYDENKCSTFDNISMPNNQIIKSSMACSSSNLLDLNSIKQETVVDESNSSFCSSSDTMSLSYMSSNAEQHKYGSSLEPPPPMSSAALASMSKQNRLNYEKRYGPIVVRPRKNPAPTLASGRKSKYTELPADEERKREIRRSRNRQAAEKCKQKRSEIEEKLEVDLKNLLNEQNSIHNEQQQLTETKQRLELIYKQHIENCAHKSNSSHAGLVYQQQTTMPIGYSTQHVQNQALSQHANLNEYSMLANNNNNNYQYSLVVNAVPYESSSSSSSSSSTGSYTQHRQLNQIIQQQSKQINHQQSNYNYENI